MAAGFDYENAVRQGARLRVATKYVETARQHFAAKGVHVDLIKLYGSMELAPLVGLADAIVDLVSSGSTLFMNGLREVETVLKSQAVLVRNEHLGSEQQQLLERFLFRIRAVKKARDNKYILLNAPNEQLPEIIRLLPGMKSPTVLPLAEAGWSSVHSVLSENDFWEIIERLKEAGAQGILVVPIEKMVI